MKSNSWKVIKLGEVANVLSGYAFKSKDFLESGVPVVKIKNIVSPYVVLDDVQYVSKELADEKRRYELKYDDVIISLTGSNVNQFESAVGKVGRVRIKNRRMMLNQRVGKFEIIDNNVYDMDFLYYLISTDDMRYRLASNAGGAANQANISPSLIKEITLPLPPISEQKIISATLRSLDNKIELNNRMNRNLEEMAQVIFKNWFVDFEPFKDGEFEESEMGIIPKGWSVVSLGELCDVQKGLSYKGKHLCDEGVPMINLGNVKPGGEFRYDKMKYYNGEFKERHVVKAGDIIIANTDMTSDRAILGSPIFVPRLSDKEIIFTHHLFSFKSLKISKMFLYYYLKSGDFRERAEGYANGTTVLAISKDDVLSIKLAVPNICELDRYDEIVRNMVEMKESNMNQNAQLENMRDELLNKLMSGEISVSANEVR